MLALHPDSIAEYNINRTKIIEITNGCDLSLMKRAENEIRKGFKESFKVIYVGHVSIERGLKLILDACCLLQKDIPIIQFILIGECPDSARKFLGETVSKYNLTNIKLLGELDHRRVLEELNQADTCLFPFPDTPELRWIYPIKVFEYMFIGKPIIATDLPGIRRILRHEVDALLFTPGNPNELCNCIKKVYLDKRLALRLGRNAKKRVEKFDWSIVHKPVISFLQIAAGEIE
ncbi:glycosyltransferase [Dissulfuribacter thermophilus]|uniref:glycosyltransferase n=1 Tax=Dissulfuribacter thermophilus TaxID=1156395 RepID=UPI00137AE112|nr:glycosyltransferase [Dissulfuribacter thermophilus]